MSADPHRVGLIYEERRVVREAALQVIRREEWDRVVKRMKARWTTKERKSFKPKFPEPTGDQLIEAFTGDNRRHWHQLADLALRLRRRRAFERRIRRLGLHEIDHKLPSRAAAERSGT